jgi:FlaA1/EpsC-like NDP-sugar epimerase
MFVMQLSSIKLSRLERRLLLLFVYTAVLVLSFLLAYQVRFEFAVPDEYRWHYVRIWSVVVVAKLLCLCVCGQFASLLTYFSLPDLRRVALATVLPFAGMLAWWHLGSAPLNSPATHMPTVPRGVIIVDTMLSFAGVVFVRILFRMVRERDFRLSGVSGTRQRVAIVGAGEVGARLAQELANKTRLGREPVVFFDDDTRKHSTRIHGIRVDGLLTAARLAELDIDEVIIAMPSAAARRMREVVALLRESGMAHTTVPSMEELASGKVQVTQLRPVEIEDLLGRERVELETGEIEELLRGQRVLVTGAGGSIGSELCRQIAGYGPESLVLVERSETQMFQVEQELVRAGHGVLITAEVADILDVPRMGRILKRHRPKILFHAAAHKHVPLMEAQPAEALRNNTLGTVDLAEAARAAGVERFVFISTDKAINPTSVMGASKRLAEVHLQALDAADGPTRFLAVRFGNVLGSSGSVVPIFRDQIAAGGPVTVTHPDVQRYFMLTSEAVGLVLQSAALGQGGGIFVLEMGTPVKIADLAEQMIELSGFVPGEEIEIKFTGLRPGEKLFEEIRLDREAFTPTSHEKILRFEAEPEPLEALRESLEQLRGELAGASPEAVRGMILARVPEYQPSKKDAPVEVD